MASAVSIGVWFAVGSRAHAKRHPRRRDAAQGGRRFVSSVKLPVQPPRDGLLYLKTRKFDDFLGSTFGPFRRDHFWRLLFVEEGSGTWKARFWVQLWPLERSLHFGGGSTLPSLPRLLPWC